MIYKKKKASFQEEFKSLEALGLNGLMWEFGNGPSFGPKQSDPLC